MILLFLSERIVRLWDIPLANVFGLESESHRSFFQSRSIRCQEPAFLSCIFLLLPDPEDGVPYFLTVILLLWPGGASSVQDVIGEDASQLRSHLRMFQDDICGLAYVRLKVIQLESGSAFRFLPGLGIGPSAGAGAHFQLPSALSDGEGAVYTLVHQIVTDFLSGLRPQGQVADTVFPFPGLQGDFQAVCHGGHEIRQTYQCAADASCPNLDWPLDDQGKSVPSLVDVRFCSSEDITGVMPFLLQFVEVRNGTAAVVRSVYHNGILQQVHLFQLPIGPARHIVAVDDEVSVFICARFSLKLDISISHIVGQYVDNIWFFACSGMVLNSLCGLFITKLFADLVIRLAEKMLFKLYQYDLKNTIQ